MHLFSLCAIIGNPLFPLSAAAPSLEVNDGGEFRISTSNDATYISLEYDTARDRFVVTRYKDGQATKQVTTNFA